MLVAVAGAAVHAAAQEPRPLPPRIVFVKEFPGSSPAYYSVAVNTQGAAVYTTAPDDPQPIIFKLSDATVKEIFETAGRLNYFKGADLETRKKVASMGKKTLRYEDGKQSNTVTFNYTENPDGAALAAMFEKISITEQHLLNLERAVRFDRLGVVKQLLQIEISMNKKELVEPAQFVPLLERIASSSSFMNIARERASGLLQKIKGGSAAGE